MRVLITGAAGRLGFVTGEALAAAGWDVLGCDLRPRVGASFPVRMLDLSTGAELEELMRGRDALVHFAGYASARLRAPQALFEHNTALDARLLAAAMAAGVRTVIFASSIQVINGESGEDSPSETFRPASLPLDGGAPPRVYPGNAYARAKQTTEHLLERLASAHPARSFVSLRLPWVVEPARHSYDALRRSAGAWARQAFAFLPLAEVPRVVEAVLRAPPPGYRSYLPAARENLFFEPAVAVAARELAEVPLTVRPEALVALVHDRHLETQTGWVPAPVFPGECAGRRPHAKWTKTWGWGRLVRGWSAARRAWLRAWFRFRTPCLGHARALLHAKARLGEGPCWDEQTQRLWWVDILAGEVHRFDPTTGRDERIALGETISAVSPAGGDRALVARQESLAWVDFASGEITPHAAGRFEGPPNRLNDGKCDVTGRFWVGSMSQNWGERSGGLYCVEPSGRVRCVLRDIVCSNGLGWSPDGRTLYYIDSGTRALEAFDFDGERGEIAGRRTVLAIAPELGLPDGLCVDRAGAVWVALNGGGCVVRIDAKRGRFTGRVLVAASQVTACAFGGPALDELYITTAREWLGPARLAEEPDAGAVFRARPGLVGLPAFRARADGLKP